MELFYVVSSYFLYALFLFPVSCFRSLYCASLRVRTCVSSTSRYSHFLSESCFSR